MNDDLLIPFVAVLLIVSAVSIILFMRRVPNFLFPNPVLDRIRQEVSDEYSDSIQKSTGLQKWWMRRKMNREVSRRMKMIVYGNRRHVH